MKICHVCGVQCEDLVELCPICGADLLAVEENEKTIKEPVILATMEDVVSAEIFKDILKENNIPYFCDESAGSGAMQVIFGGSFVSEEIYVDKSDFEEAELLYEEFIENEPMFEEDFFEEDFEEE